MNDLQTKITLKGLLDACIVRHGRLEHLFFWILWLIKKLSMSKKYTGGGRKNKHQMISFLSRICPIFLFYLVHFAILIPCISVFTRIRFSKEKWKVLIFWYQGKWVFGNLSFVFSIIVENEKILRKNSWKFLCAKS